MAKEDTKQLGDYLKTARTERGWSAHELSRRTGIHPSTIIRIEDGEFNNPRPEKLAVIAEELGLSLADVYARANYATPSDLPSLTPYLRTKYAGLPEDEIKRIQTYVAQRAKQHGIDLDGPKPGQDETP